MSLDKKIYGEVSLSDLFQEIHSNSKSTRTQVTALISELKPLIESIGDATLVVPMIKEYMEIGVKNDEHLIKMAAIIQRMESGQSKGEEFDLSDLADLLQEAEQANKEIKEVNDDEDGEQ